MNYWRNLIVIRLRLQRLSPPPDQAASPRPAPPWPW
jgi:hypothetical protein